VQTHNGQCYWIKYELKNIVRVIKYADGLMLTNVSVLSFVDEFNVLTVTLI
jgi:hypothetical protein